jgi:alkylation response protein AidB-like acyl-CoA dehydrogenase
MATEIEAARHLVYDAVWKVNKGEYPVREISMAKLYTGLVVNRITNHAMQIFGGAAYLMDVPIQRAWRDSRVMRIGGGADEVMREIISKMRGM